MSETIKNESELNPSTGLKIILCLFIGVLSTFFAEVLSGSFPLWFMDLWGLLVVLPLYMMHLLFLLNMAIRTKRISIPQLYLWGVIFALYESWITKVLWFGYPAEQGAQFGLFFGIATAEFMILVFFFHPIFAFILPILVFEILANSKNSPENLDQIVITSHLPFLEKKKKVIGFLIFIIIFGSSFVVISSAYNIIIVLLALLVNIGIIFLLYLLITKKTSQKPREFSIYSLKLGKTGFSIVIIYLVLLYFIMFFLLLPERLPNSIIPYLIIIGFYIFVGITLYLSKPYENEKIDEFRISERLFSLRDLVFFFVILTLLAVLFCLIPLATLIIGTLTYLTILFGSVVFFIIMVVYCFKRKKIESR